MLPWKQKQQQRMHDPKLTWEAMEEFG